MTEYKLYDEKDFVKALIRMLEDDRYEISGNCPKNYLPPYVFDWLYAQDENTCIWCIKFMNLKKDLNEDDIKEAPIERGKIITSYNNDFECPCDFYDSCEEAVKYAWIQLDEKGYLNEFETYREISINSPSFGGAWL